jgi:hypothetical protein
MSKFSSTGSSDVIADSKTVVYATAGNYVMNMETQTDATAFNVKIEVVKANVPVYTLNVNNQVVASGSTIKINEGGSVVFKVLNSAGVAVMTKFSSTGISDVVADSKTAVYPTAGTYTMNMETQADATAFNVKIEVVKASAAVYILKINNETIANGATVKTMEGTMLPFKVLDATGKAVLAKFSFGEGTVVTSDGRSMSYATAGNYQFQAEVDGTIIKATIEVAKIANPVYILKVNNQVIANGATLKMVEGTSTYFKVVNESGAAVVAAYAFGDNTTETTDIAAKIYVAGTYKVTITIGTTVLTVNLEVTKAVTPTYTLKINNEAVSNMSTVKTTEGASLAFKVVNADGKTFTAAMDLGNGTKITTDNASVTYLAGTYKLSATVDGQTITQNVEVTKSIIPPTKPEAVILISSSVSGSTINAILGLRCDAINNVSFTKDTYVAGEIPGKDWTDYKLTETIVIDGVKYFKWSVSAPTGKYRFGWLQMKDGGTDLYKNGSWSNDLNSAFFNTKEGLFVLYLRVDNNIVKLTAN